jgi:hypothetical protein
MKVEAQHFSAGTATLRYRLPSNELLGYFRDVPGGTGFSSPIIHPASFIVFLPLDGEASIALYTLF